MNHLPSLFNQGMVLKYSEKSGLVEKMSKSIGNVVNPDDIVKEYGSDALRLIFYSWGHQNLIVNGKMLALKATSAF